MTAKKIQPTNPSAIGAASAHSPQELTMTSTAFTPSATSTTAQDSTPGSGWSHLRRAALTLLGMLALVTSLVAGTASSASAYSVRDSWGSPGTAATPPTYAASTGFAAGSVTVPYRWVTESARYAGYDQYVCVTAMLVESSASRFWIFSDSSRSCAWIPSAATWANVNGAVFSVMGFNAFIYSVNVKVTWQLSNGAYIGTRTYDYDATGDYRCSTAYCRVGMTAWGGGAFVELSF